MEIKINDYYEPDHFRAISEDNYNISRTCEYEKNEMHHIHNTSEILLVEDGAADYYISGRKYHVEPYDILVIGAMEHHLRRIDRLPFQDTASQPNQPTIEVLSWTMTCRRYLVRPRRMCLSKIIKMWTGRCLDI